MRYPEKDLELAKSFIVGLKKSTTDKTVLHFLAKAEAELSIFKTKRPVQVRSKTGKIFTQMREEGKKDNKEFTSHDGNEVNVNRKQLKNIIENISNLKVDTDYHQEGDEIFFDISSQEYDGKIKNSTKQKIEDTFKNGKSGVKITVNTHDNKLIVSLTNPVNSLGIS